MRQEEDEEVRQEEVRQEEDEEVRQVEVGRR